MPAHLGVALASAVAAYFVTLATTAGDVIEALPFALTGGSLFLGVGLYLFRELRTNSRLDDLIEQTNERAATADRRAQRAERRAAHAERLVYSYLGQMAREGLTPEEWPGDHPPIPPDPETDE